MPWDYERERIRALAQKSPERLAVHFLQSPIGIIEWSLSHHVVEWNPAAERILGLRREKALGKHAATFFLAEDYAEIEQTWKGYLANREGNRLTCRNVTAESEEIWCHWSNTPLLDERGRVMAILSHIEDVTSRRRIENSLHIHACAIRTALVPIVMFDSTGRLSYVNNAFVEQWGAANHQDMIGRRLGQFLQDEEGLQSVLAKLAAEGRWAGELKGRRRDGRLFDVQVSASLARSREGQTLCMMASLVDITERKRSEAAIRELNAELEQRVNERTTELKIAYQELEAFSYSVSHDLRAPLRHINGFSSLLEQDYGPALDAQAHDLIRRIRAAIGRMEALIEDLLSLSRINRAVIIQQEFDLGSLAETVAEALRNVEPQRSVRFVMPQSLAIKADPGLMCIVLENLLGNAWKFSSRKQEAIIELGTLKTAKGEKVIFVRDNGAGFDTQYADKLFSPFQRLHRSEEFPGSGIGLSIVQRIIHRHGGRIWAEGSVGKGATFCFTIENG